MAPRPDDAATASATPAGWYPVAEGSTQLRYWDGTAWTEQLHDPVSPATIAAIVPRRPLRAPDGTNPSTPWIWILAFCPLLSLISGAPTLFSLQNALNADFSHPDAVLNAVIGPLSWLTLAGGLLSYGLVVLVSALDYRALVRLDIPLPFHWAWSFLSGIVYVVGRGVVARRRAGRGLAPTWVFISLEFAIAVVSLVVTVELAIQLSTKLAGLATT